MYKSLPLPIYNSSMLQIYEKSNALEQILSPDVVLITLQFVVNWCVETTLWSFKLLLVSTRVCVCVCVSGCNLLKL